MNSLLDLSNFCEFTEIYIRPPPMGRGKATDKVGYTTYHISSLLTQYADTAYRITCILLIAILYREY